MLSHRATSGFRSTGRRPYRFLAVAAAAAAGLALAIVAIVSQTGTTPPSMGTVIAQADINTFTSPSLAAQTTAQISAQPSTTASTVAEKVFVRYVDEWWSHDTGLEVNFTKTGVAYVKWGQNLPCGTHCTYRMNITFTIAGRTSQRLNGKITWTNGAVTAQGTFKVGQAVQLLGYPNSNHLTLVSADGPALLTRH